MKRSTAAAAVMAALICPCLHAEPAPAGLDARLRALGYAPDVDGAGDYRLLFELGPGQAQGRRQITYVGGREERYGALAVREIWSPAYQAPGKELPAEVANRLLEDARQNIVGGWAREGGTAVYVVQVPATLSGPPLADAIEAATRAADAMEAELTPGQDAF